MASQVQRLFASQADSSSLYTALAVGAISGVLLPEIASFLSWFRLHFVSKSSLSRYQHVVSSAGEKTSGRAWALVTGASDGIGYGFVQELAANNFNVILHGRNAVKIEGLIKQLRSVYPDVEFESFICNSTDRDSWPRIDELTESLVERKVPLTVLVNNVGGNPVQAQSFSPLVDYSLAELTALIDLNATFPAQVTRSLLPVLTQNKPSLVLNMSSASGLEFCTLPYLSGYAGGKAYDRQFSKTLRLEMVALGHPEVEVVSVMVGRVQSAGAKCNTSTMTPSSRRFAASTLRLAGCGRDEITGWWAHDLQIWGMSILPEWVRKIVLLNVAASEKRFHEAVWKKDP